MTSIDDVSTCSGVPKENYKEFTDLAKGLRRLDDDNISPYKLFPSCIFQVWSTIQKQVPSALLRMQRHADNLFVGLA